MIVLIDNYDSFTYNIVHYLNEIGKNVRVYRNDAITIDEIKKLKPDHIIISPGPKEPKDAGISKDVVKVFAGQIPILGICLGHQTIGEVFGGKIVRSKAIVHGKVKDIFHDGKTIFSGIESPCKATRYHSLILDRATCPECLEISATAENGEIMAVRHKTLQVEGMQFHPESILTEFGKQMLSNFIQGASKSISIKAVLKQVVGKQNLTEEDAVLVMDRIMSGIVTPSQIGSLLTGLRMKGESVEEITGFAKTMRKKAERIKLPEGNVVDTCGTGGDAKGTFNISTASAFVAAGAGSIVAKHGNRAISGSSGSADVLEKLGVNIMISSQKVEQCIRDVGIGFLFAPSCHKAMKYAMGTRREIGIRTVFNVLGPLSNPSGVKHQVMGVFDAALTEKLATVLGRLGDKRAFVIAADDGLDEVTLTGKTKISELKNGEVTTYKIDPKNFGFSYCALDVLRAESISESAEIISKVLQGEKCPARDIVVLNAMLAIIASGIGNSFEDGIKKAQESIDSGRAYKKLCNLVEYTNKNS